MSFSAFPCFLQRYQITNMEFVASVFRFGHLYFLWKKEHPSVSVSSIGVVCYLPRMLRDMVQIPAGRYLRETLHNSFKPDKSNKHPFLISSSYFKTIFQDFDGQRFNSISNSLTSYMYMYSFVILVHSMLISQS